MCGGRCWKGNWGKGLVCKIVYVYSYYNGMGIISN